jgi:hypothetical protein
MWRVQFSYLKTIFFSHLRINVFVINYKVLLLNITNIRLNFNITDIAMYLKDKSITKKP